MLEDAGVENEIVEEFGTLSFFDPRATGFTEASHDARRSIRRFVGVG